MSELKKVEIFTDGACSGNPGPGGWGAVLRYGEHEAEMSGGDANTTNNRMELMAVISAVERLKEPCDIKIYTDSQYVANAFLKGWIWNWKKNGWKKSDKKPVLNPELWERLLKALSKHEYEFIWVKGHAGHPENERCDRLAVAQSEIYAKKCAEDEKCRDNTSGSAKRRKRTVCEQAVASAERKVQCLCPGL